MGVSVVNASRRKPCAAAVMIANSKSDADSILFIVLFSLVEKVFAKVRKKKIMSLNYLKEMHFFFVLSSIICNFVG
jgi:hypothetical protein